jgi:ligand-binding sensor domain-containing protein
MGESPAAGCHRARHYLRHWFTGVAWCLATTCLFAATPDVATLPPVVDADAGLPLVRNFTPSEYGGAAQNWAIAQDRDGVVYVGNVESGVLAFDGARWNAIPVPNHATVRSLALGPDGRIYVGTVGDLGYLKRDANGRLVFASLLDRVPPAERDFADVWSIHATSQGVYFATVSSLFYYAHGVMQVWKPATQFHLSFVVNDTLYVREVGRGLMQMVNGQLRLMPGGGRFADDKVYALLPWHGPGATSGDLLLGTRSQGWFHYHAGTFTPWPVDAAAAIQHNGIYGAAWLADGSLAVNTLRGGVYVIDAHGHLAYTLDYATGLQSNLVLAMFVDRDHGLWLATGNGVARVNANAPLTVFDARNGLRGEVQALHRYAGTLFVGTTEGLYRLVPGANAHFTPIAQTPGQNWALVETNGDLVVAGDDGVFAYTDHGPGHAPSVTQITRGTAALALRRSAHASNRLFVGYQDGFGSIRHTPHGWVDEGRIDAIHGQVRAIAQDADGSLWLSPWVGGLIRLRLGPETATGSRGPARIERFGPPQGLPEGLVRATRIDDKLRFITDAGIYRRDAASGRFLPAADAADLVPDTTLPVDSLYQDRRGEVWTTITDAKGIRHTGRAVRRKHGWQWTVTPLQLIKGAGANVYLDAGDGALWLGGDNGLFRYRRTPAFTPSTSPDTLLRLVGEQGGSALYGAWTPADLLQVPYAHNAVRFEFALPGFDRPDGNRYQVWLQGLDPGWSPWAADAYRDYTSLAPGLYRFHVRGRDAYGQTAREARFDFRVLPPWYRTWWAWLAWITLAAGALFLLVRWRSTRLRRRNRALEALVQQRTTELAQANAALRTVNQALAQQAVTDPLTGLKNRRYLKEFIRHDILAAQQAGAGRLLFLMIDIDHFKAINDAWGHAAGDRVLQQLRDILLAAIHATDIPVRRGGEEFLIVARNLPHD